MSDDPLVRIGTDATAKAPAERTRYLVSGTIAPRFVEAHALAAPDAIPFVPADERERRAFARMIKDGSIRAAAGDRFYFDMAAYEAAAVTRARRRLPIWIVAAVLAAIVAVLFYRG